MHEYTAAGRLKPVYGLMGDPRNVAHAKKATQEKQHKTKAAQKTRVAQTHSISPSLFWKLPYLAGDGVGDTDLCVPASAAGFFGTLGGGGVGSCR